MASSLKELIQQDIVKIAKLPKMNSIEISELDSLDGYTVPLIDHDYPAGTPRMWNSAYQSLGLNIRSIMVVANPKDIPTIFQAFKQDKKYLGGGAGSGFKDSSVEHLEELSEDAERIGSINLIVKKEGENGSRLIGHNTDGIGYVKGLEKEFGKGIIYNKNILILGAGGVTSSVVYHLLQKDPKSLTILNRTVSKANKIAEHMKGFFPGLKENIKFGGEDKIGELLNRADMVINVSNKGTEGSLSKFSAFATASKESDENVPN